MMLYIVVNTSELNRPHAGFHIVEHAFTSLNQAVRLRDSFSERSHLKIFQLTEVVVEDIDLLKPHARYAPPAIRD